MFKPLPGNISIDRITMLFGQDLEDSPETINESPYEEGWLVKIRALDIAQIDDLLTDEEYERVIAEE